MSTQFANLNLNELAAWRECTATFLTGYWEG